MPITFVMTAQDITRQQPGNDDRTRTVFWDAPFADYQATLSPVEFQFLANIRIFDETGRNTAQVTCSNVAPTPFDSLPDYECGDIWVNETTGIVYILIDDTPDAAIWGALNEGAALDWKESVINYLLTAPPGAPVLGNRYVVAVGGTGAWLGHDNEIATWNGSIWTFEIVNEGAATWSETQDVIIVFDGVAWNVLPTIPLSNTPPINVTKAAASAGVATEASRQDHKHDVDTAAPSQGIGGSNAEGSATSLSRSDHDHTLRTTSGPADLTIAGITDGEFLKRSGTTITSAPAAALTSSAPVDVTKAAAAVGVATDAARADHKHDITTAAPAATGVATASAEGVATTLSRSDHAHQSNTAPVNVTKAAAAIGVSGQPARADHKHDIATAVPATVGAANAEGSATSLARSDHVHSHGNQAGGTLHALVTALLAGFMSAADKNKLDTIGTPRQEPVTTQLITAADVVLADTLNFTPVSNASVRLYLNGVFQVQGAGNDYTISTTSITWLASSGTAVNMKLTDVLIAVYQS